MTSRKTFADPAVPVADYLGTLGERRRTEAETLIALLSDVTGEPPVMWGSAIIGFGNDDPDGSAGWPTVSFAPRKAKISLYLTDDAERYREQLAAMGRHTTGKGCIYLTRLDDVDLGRLRELVEQVLRDRAH